MQQQSFGVTSTATSDGVILTTRPPRGLGIVTIVIGSAFAFLALLIGWKSGMGFETWLFFAVGALVIISGLPMLFLKVTVIVSADLVSAKSTLSIRSRPIAIPRSEVTAVYLQKLTRPVRTGKMATTDVTTNNLFLVLNSGDDTLLMQSPNFLRVQEMGREVCKALGLSEEEIDDPVEEWEDQGHVE